MTYTLLIWVHVLAATAAIGSSLFGLLMLGGDAKRAIDFQLENGRWVSRAIGLSFVTGVALAAFWTQAFKSMSIYAYLIFGKILMILAIGALAGVLTAKARRAISGQANIEDTLKASKPLKIAAVLCGMAAVLFGTMMRGI